MAINKEDEIFEVKSGWDFPCEECPEWIKNEERCFWDGKDVPLCFIATFDEYWGKECFEFFKKMKQEMEKEE